MIGLIHTTVSNQVLHSDPVLNAATIYLAVFAIAGAFELVFAFDSLRLKNVFQLLALLFFLTTMLVYGALLHGQLHNTINTANVGWDSGYADPTCLEGNLDVLNCFDGTTPLFSKIDPYLIVIPVILGVSLLIQSYLTYRLVFEFGWASFKRIGASRQLQSYYDWYLGFVCLLKLTAFFAIAFAVQLLILTVSDKTAEFSLTIAALPISVVLLIFAAICVRKEWKGGMMVVFAGEVAGVAYFMQVILTLSNCLV